MDGLFTLLILAVLIYLLMRFGCGAHMVHGHGHGTGHGGKHADKHVDPVCGMEIRNETGYSMMHEGNLFRFCTRNCLDKFEAEPEKYTSHSQYDKGDET